MTDRKTLMAELEPELDRTIDVTGWGAECLAQQAYMIMSERKLGDARVKAFQERMRERKVNPCDE